MSEILRTYTMPEPKGWVVDSKKPDGARYRNRARGLVVIISACIMGDGKPWVHLSLSHHKRIPTWGELASVKQEFLGDAYAYQILPPKELYVNINKKVLHLFMCPDGPQLPEMSGVVPGLGRSI